MKRALWIRTQCACFATSIQKEPSCLPKEQCRKFKETYEIPIIGNQKSPVVEKSPVEYSKSPMQYQILTTKRALLNTKRVLLNTKRALLNKKRALLNTKRICLSNGEMLRTQCACFAICAPIAPDILSIVNIYIYVCIYARERVSEGVSEWMDAERERENEREREGEKERERERESEIERERESAREREHETGRE